TIIPLIKYVCIVIWADYDCEGGTFSLYSSSSRKFVQTCLLVLVFFGASTMISDGLLTPAVTVISAIEGIVVPAPSLKVAIVPL
ncbi:20823_t:CDS:2, partial [Racocetra persica]